VPPNRAREWCSWASRRSAANARSKTTVPMTVAVAFGGASLLSMIVGEVPGYLDVLTTGIGLLRGAPPHS